MRKALTVMLISMLMGSFMQYGIAADVSLKLGEETIPDNENEVIARIVKLQTGIMQATKQSHLRGQHPKAHGCVEATFTVLPDIPPELRLGIFQTPKDYQALIRFSNGAKFSDSEPDIHGMAIKLSGIEGRQALPGVTNDTQDFVLIDNETFFTPDAETLLRLMEAKAAAQKDPAAIKAFAEKNPEILPRVEKTKKLIHSPLATSYWSAVPYKLGNQAVKYSAKPDNALPDDYLRDAMAERLSKPQSEVVFSFHVQQQTDVDAMPIENPTVPWTSPEIKVATIRIAPQVFDSPERNKACEESSFSPWHALEVHQPLGGINRARKAVYEASSALRHQVTP